MSIEFEWDPLKAELNRRKHGVSFEIAARVFADPFALSWLERIENAEQRWQTLGIVEGHVLVLVVHTTREPASHEIQQAPDDQTDQTEEVIRIISARRADRTERQRYERENR